MAKSLFVFIVCFFAFVSNVFSQLDTCKCAKTIVSPPPKKTAVSRRLEREGHSQMLANEINIELPADSVNCCGDVVKDPSPWYGLLFPDVLWIGFWVLLLLLLRTRVFSFCDGVLLRLKHGSAMKIGSFEIEGLNVNHDGGHGRFNVKEMHDQKWREIRSDIYKQQRGVMLIHKIFKSAERDQKYDLLMYVIPHQGSSLRGVSSIDYYFGDHWGARYFESTDRANGFPIVTSAYGEFLCLAKINFTDGESCFTHRYIDFEMGAIAPVIENKK